MYYVQFYPLVVVSVVVLIPKNISVARSSKPYIFGIQVVAATNITRKPKIFITIPVLIYQKIDEKSRSLVFFSLTIKITISMTRIAPLLNTIAFGGVASKNSSID